VSGETLLGMDGGIMGWFQCWFHQFSPNIHGEPGKGFTRKLLEAWDEKKKNWQRVTPPKAAAYIKTGRSLGFVDVHPHKYARYARF